MKSEFKAKLIQHLLNKKNSEKGFTLIELLVVIIIIGILAAIALPSFLNQANKARQSEARTYVGSINRAQQAYYLENTAWGTDLRALELGINTETAWYRYQIGTGADASAAAAAGNAGDSSIQAVAGTFGTKTTVKRYRGSTYLALGTTGEATSLAILCEEEKANTTPAASGFPAGSNVLAASGTGSTATCLGGYKPLN